MERSDEAHFPGKVRFAFGISAVTDSLDQTLSSSHVSKRKPGTRLNSRTLPLTKVA